MNKLECIGVPILVGGSKLVEHFKTVDVPLKRYYILDNSQGKDPGVEEAIDEIIESKPDYIDQIVIAQNNLNAGFAGSVNQIIKDNTDCKHWIITGFDWHLHPGEWQKVLDKIPNLPFGAYLSNTPLDFFCGFVWTPQLLNRVGMLDENFFPGYFEDNDYRRRVRLTQTPVDTLPLLAHHDRSSTLNSSSDFKKKNQYTFNANYQYYVNKWGGAPDSEKYDTPFGQSYPIDYWQFDPARRQKLRWL